MDGYSDKSPDSARSHEAPQTKTSSFSDYDNIYLAPVSWGLGDLVVSLPAYTALHKQAPNSKLFLIARSQLQMELAPRIDSISGVLPESSFDPSFMQEKSLYINMREHPIQTDYWWGSPEFEQAYPGLKINEILGVICRDLSIEADFFDLEPLRASEIAKTRPFVALIPGSDGKYKQWPTAHWLGLAEHLRKRSYEPVIIGKPDSCPATRNLLEAGLSWRPTHTVEEAIDLLTAAEAVIAVDTGLMHIAITQGTPTICLFRKNAIYIRSYPHSIALESGECHPRCLEKSNSVAYSSMTEFKEISEDASSSGIPGVWSCDLSDEERCMSSITTEEAIEALEALSSRIRGRSPASGDTPP